MTKRIATPPYQLRPLGDEKHTAEDFFDATKDALGGPTLDGTNPLGDNFRRASFAAEAVATYGRRTGIAGSESIFLAIGDLLSDLRHLLDLAAESDVEGDMDTLEGLLERGAVHYEAEIRGEL